MGSSVLAWGHDISCNWIESEALNYTCHYIIKRTAQSFLFKHQQKRHCIYFKNPQAIVTNRKLCKYCSLCIGKVIVNKRMQLIVTM